MTHKEWTKWEDAMFIKMAHARTTRDRVEIMQEEIKKVLELDIDEVEHVGDLLNHIESLKIDRGIT